MSTHFLFNQSVLRRPGVWALIRDLRKSLLPVAIISERLTTSQLRKKIHERKVPGLIIMGCDQAAGLKNLYSKAASECEEMRYLTVVFDDTRVGMHAAVELGFYVVALRTENLRGILRRLSIEAPHQLQYLPEIEKIRNFMKNKMGYPASLYQCLQGKFNNAGVELGNKCKKLAGGPWLNTGGFNFFINNLGDPFFLSENFMGHSCLFEQDVIDILGRYYGLPRSKARGFVTSGGTEGNFAGLWWARDYLRLMMATQLSQPAADIVLYFSTATHYSIPKIAWQLGLRPQPIFADPSGRIDLHELTQVVKQHMQNHPQIPMIINANAGTTKTGAIDDLPAIKKILDKTVRQAGGHCVVHLDAAIMGAVLPLVEPFGPEVKNYFADLGISTIAISGHKFLGTTDICGIVLTTQEFLTKSTRYDDMNITYMGHIHDVTPSGSRSGNHVLQIHNLLYQLDFPSNQARLKKVVTQCRKNCEYLYERLCTLFPREEILWLPHSFCITFPKPADALIRKYSLMPVAEKRVGVYGWVNLDKKLTDAFIKDCNRK